MATSSNVCILRSTVTRDVRKTTSEAKLILANMFLKLDHKVCICFDAWSDSGSLNLGTSSSSPVHISSSSSGISSFSSLIPDLSEWNDYQEDLSQKRTSCHDCEGNTSCPASRVSVEQAFSVGGYILDERQSRLTPQNLEAQTLLNDVVKASYTTKNQIIMNKKTEIYDTGSSNNS
ncbi:hypothetical protein OROMI_003501 [Orobanche minor]